MIAALALLLAGPPDDAVRVSEHVEVERVLVEVRVLDGARAVPGLGTDDFELKVGGEVVPLESAHWVPAHGGRDDGAPASPARTVVFFVQKDLQARRGPGLLRMLLRAQEVLDGLPREDRVAVASFDSQLKLWTDAGRDREGPREALRHAVLFDARPPPLAREEGSLASHFDAEAARKAATTETGLLVLARALRAIDGPKVVVFVGWGLGRYTTSGVRAEPDYEEARRALLAAHATVFTLDITDADYHSLELGLQALAEHTGGFYARTHLSTGGVIARLRGALAGHYVLAFERPVAEGDGRLRVGLRGRRGAVLARSHSLRAR